MINFIRKEEVIAIVMEMGSPELLKRIEGLWSFPAPNPDQLGGKNIMGQTEDEFWDAVDRQEK